MPELPEVETVRSVIEPQIMGRRIVSIDVRQSQIIAHPAANELIEKVCGRTFMGMGRRGKYLSIDLDHGKRLFLHLRMTGQLIVAPPDFPVEKHTHLIMHLSDGNQLRYTDVRRFGRFWYIERGESEAVVGIDRLGMEPMDEALDAHYLKARLGSKKRPIKEMLHDQSVVTGIGNIYSDEILYAAGIHPARSCAALADDEWQKLALQIPKVIRWGIETNAITPEDYLSGRGRDYRNSMLLKVYGRVDQPCPRCGERLRKMSICGRTATFCPNCQR